MSCYIWAVQQFISVFESLIFQASKMVPPLNCSTILLSTPYPQTGCKCSSSPPPALFLPLFSLPEFVFPFAICFVFAILKNASCWQLCGHHTLPLTFYYILCSIPLYWDHKYLYMHIIFIAIPAFVLQPQGHPSREATAGAGLFLAAGLCG